MTTTSSNLSKQPPPNNSAIHCGDAFCYYTIVEDLVTGEEAETYCEGVVVLLTPLTLLPGGAVEYMVGWYA